MYDELLERLHQRIERIALTRAGSPLQDDLREAADAIEELSMKLHGDEAAIAGMKREIERMVVSGNKPRWIPVTERLPKEHDFVLIRQDDDRMMIAERVDGDWWYRYYAYDVARWDENEQGTITHWMPLPQPPKEET